MSYSGNPALAQDVQERILSTFRQTLDLAAAGSVQEATLGCDFILRMDPQFEAARTLLGRLEQATGPVVVDDLRRTIDGGGNGAGGAEPSADELFDDLDDLDLETSSALGTGDARQRAEEALARRDFAAVLALADQGAADPELTQLAKTAAARQEAAPYVQRFVESARQALQSGSRDEARGFYDKARSLDPSHPGVRELEDRLDSAAAAAPAPTEVFGGAPPASPGGGVFETSPPPAAGGGDRISTLLQEGQQAFDRSDHQGAIDAWSRIFLIDVDHEEAARRIENARRLKAEHERQIEELFHDASSRLDQGDREAARQGFERVLELQPDHLAAREQLDQLAAAAAAAAAPAAPAPAAAPSVFTPPPAARPPEPAELSQEILVPPEPGAVPAPAAEAPPAARAAAPRGPGRWFLLIGSLVLVVALVAAVFLYLNRERFFPNAQAPAAAPAAVDALDRAVALHDSGKVDRAIAVLRKLPADAPRYEEAQALISQWEAEVAGAEGESAAAAEAPAPAEAELFAELTLQARQAVAAGELLRAEELFERATELSSLSADDQALRDEVATRLEPLAHYIDLFREGEYEFALPDLWRLLDDQPDDSVVRRLVADSYYNLAVRDLQRGDAEGAVQKLEEVLEVTPGDAVAKRHLQLAETYRQREKDLLYRIYVKYLPMR